VLFRSVVVSPGAKVTGWAIKIKSHVAYNVYSVRVIVMSVPGSMPFELGEQMEAVNLAESFLSQGTVSAGKCAIMCRVGETNVFYAVP
jgi:hypothetical protein